MDVFLMLIIAVVVIWYVEKKHNPDKKLISLIRKDPATIDRYTREFDKFRTITTNEVIAKFGPLLELPEDIRLACITYLVQASSSACKYAGVDARLHDTMNMNFLVRIGISRDMAEGMVAAMALPTSQAGTNLTHDLGGSAFSAWVRNGEKAAQEHIQEAMAVWQRVSNIADEIEAVRGNKADGFEDYKKQYIEEVKRLDPDAVHKDMHWLQFADDDGTRKAYQDGVDPIRLAEIVLKNVQITDMH